MQAYKPLFVDFYHLQLILSPVLFNEELIFFYISKVSLVFDGIFVFDIIWVNISCKNFHAQKNCSSIKLNGLKWYRPK